MNNHVAFDAEWSPNAVGQISPLVVRLKARRFLAMVRRDAAVLTVLMVGLFSSYFYFGVLPETKGIDLGGIHCMHLQPMVPQMLSGELDRETTRKIDRHLRSCSYCSKYVEHIRLEAEQQSPDTERELDWKHARNPQMVATRGAASGEQSDRPVPATVR